MLKDFKETIRSRKTLKTALEKIFKKATPPELTRKTTEKLLKMALSKIHFESKTFFFDIHKNTV